ncbi:PREDICTED: leucine-rich repeat-containing protein 7 isoform X1 [Nanorana parkeri]|uniref:leucine-rich repeat-containing protein 7 isoform X1 n=1 Tax=Nanorana parkeri TaxID=125878 RepID=UPI00085475E3|nr:PREDICTED: leucine-rich repeat-containing protein 7 isoform X1 [Nanorana parkeri]
MENLRMCKDPAPYQGNPAVQGMLAPMKKRPEEEMQCLEMTTKRKIIGRLVPCRCFRGEEEIISVLDYSHCSLQQVPKEVFSLERTLEELYLDANQIEELPKQLFGCQALKKLSIPDNDLSNLPATISSLVNLKELDISKNGIQEFPDNIKCCKCLTIVEASVNPISKLPDGFTQLLNLTQLYLNDAFLEYLPANFGRLSKLRILELRENHLKTLPKSMNKLTQLERLDLGNNEFSELPEGLEQIQHLKELWMDNNSLQKLPGSIGKLKHLIYLDMSKNRIEAIEMEVSGCECLEDLLLSSNLLQHLPDSLGLLKKLTTLKIDDNQLVALPNTIGNLSLLEEFDCSCNELESLPPTIGYLHSLRTMAVDENFLTELPREIGNCKNVTVMSLRSNKLEFLPEEIGQMTKLRVLNLSDNRLKNLPFSFTKLKELAALWLSDNQSKALIPLQTEAHPDTKQRVLTNYMFPQQPRGDEDFQSDSDSFNPALWEEQRQQRMTVAFEFEDKKEEEEGPGKVKVEINLKRYPTPYPEDLKNMVKSVQNMVGKSHSSSLENSIPTPTPSAEQNLKEKYEHKWPMPTKEMKSEVSNREHKEFQKSQMSESSNIRSYSLDVPKRKEKEEHSERTEEPFGHRPPEMRMAELRPSLIETPLYPPKLVLLGKDKKESTDDSEMDKHHHNSVSSGTYSDYSPSQASSGSSNARIKVQISAKEAVNSSLWGNRLTQSFPQQIESKPLLSQRETAPMGNLQQRNDRQNLNDSFTENWNNSSHYDNTGFVAEENTVDSSGGNPMLNSKSRSTSAHGRRPLIRQDRIIGIPLELEQSTQRNPQEPDVSPSNPWQNWTRTPSPFEDRTAFPSKLEATPVNSPLPERKEHKPQSLENPSTFSSTPPWEFHDTGPNRNIGNVFSHGHCRPESAKNTISVSKSTERLSPLMKDLKTGRFKKSQSIDEIDIGAFKVYNIPLQNYDPRNIMQGSHDRPDLGMMQEHSMSRSQSVPMLDDELLCYGTSRGQPQKPVAKKVYQFDQSFNPQGAVEVKPEKRVPPPFSYNPDYSLQQTKSMAKDLISPRAYRGYPPMEQMFSFSQPSVNENTIPPQFTNQSSRPGFLKRADSLASATEMSMYRRVSEPHEIPQTDRYGRAPFLGAIERQSSMSVAESQFLKRNGRYDDDHTSYPDMKPQAGSYQVKTLTQRRPLSARSYSTETYGTAQTRPVSARPTMAALLEKIPSDYNLVNYGEKSADSEIKARQNQAKLDESINKMPPDWRQQLLRHIEARRLDRTPSQQSNILDNGQEDLSLNQWNPYPLGRRDVPPETVAKKAGSHIQTLMGSQSLQHRSREQPHYDGGMNKVTIQQYQSPLPIQIPAAQRGPQSGRCLIQTKGQRSMDGYPEQYCVRIEKNPGLGFSISGGLSGQGNPFKPSDKGIFVTRVQPDGPAYGVLRPGDKILQANGHSFVNMEHEKAVALLKSFQTTVDLVIQPDLLVLTA